MEQTTMTRQERYSNALCGIAVRTNGETITSAVKWAKRYRIDANTIPVLVQMGVVERKDGKCIWLVDSQWHDVVPLLLTNLSRKKKKQDVIRYSYVKSYDEVVNEVEVKTSEKKSWLRRLMTFFSK